MALRVPGTADEPLDANAGSQPQVGHSPNVRWHDATITREQRWGSLGLSGATVWLTGLPAAGKSTIGRAVEQMLVANGRPAYLLDGDNLRCGLNGDLGFDEAARIENVRRTSHVARLLADSGVIALVSVISPFAADRELAAALHRTEGLTFLEAFVCTPITLCEERDPKGLYARAHAGELTGMTGVDSPYEVPQSPDVILRTDEMSVSDAAICIIETLKSKCLLNDLND
jgi:adenylyl-sulfate kinase